MSTLSLQSYLLFFLVVFVAYLTGKTIVFHRKFKINPVEFSNLKEKVQFCAWMGLMVVLVIYGVLVILMFAGKNVGGGIEGLNNVWVHLVGMALTVGGFVMMVAAHAHMGKEWRMGFDREGNVRLVTTRLFSLSRNPVYVAIVLQTLGIGLLMNVVVAFELWGVLLLFMIVVIRTEERFLKEKFGEEYLRYKKRVRRFL